MYDPDVVDRFMSLDRSALMERPGGEYTRVIEQLRPSSGLPVRTVDGASVAAPHVVAPEPVSAPPPALVHDHGLGAGFLTHARAVLGLSTRLVSEIVPGATGAWFTVDPAQGRPRALHPFGPGAHLLTARTIKVGEQLTRWVAAYVKRS
jgi:hypothetical protein